MAIKISGTTVISDDYKILNTNALTKDEYVAPQAITVTTGTTVLDFSVAKNFHLTLQSSTTFSLSNVAANVGSSGTIIIKQDAVGGRTFTKSAEMKTPLNGAGIAQVTAPNTVSLLSYYIVDSTTVIINYIGDFA